MKYDYLIIGSGLFGSTCAYELSKKGKKVLVLEKREHIGGNIYTEEVENINIHKYGAHIFHTNDKYIWDYINQFSEFNRFTNSPLAFYKDKLYNLPFNMNTFYQLWGVTTPQAAKDIINKQKVNISNNPPTNLEEQAISLVGKDIYEILIKGYTEKQWGRNATELPTFIINRIPVRFNFDNNYFSDRYQGIPIGGYTKIIEKMLASCDVKLNINYLDNKEYYNSLANKIIYTGPIDEFFQYCHGKLQYRSLRFEESLINSENYQGNAVINYTDINIPYTRIIEHKHFEDSNSTKTIITKEFPIEWSEGEEAYYPINDAENMELLKKYRLLSKNESKIIFGGRLAEYKYYDMHQVIKSALNTINNITI